MIHKNVMLLLLWWWSLLVSVARGDPAGSACSMLKAAYPQRVAQHFSMQYLKDNLHWTLSSAQLSRCSVQPTSPAEVATIFHIINETRTPWAVKGGGHAYNRGHSSTSGVQIAMTQFNTVRVEANASTAHIGAGLTWDAVYAALGPHGVSVVGGRVAGVGVAGVLLGGGYGWHTQQYGLAIDNVISYDLVTPTGDILTVTAQSNRDLFFALRGGGNNFGIVTGFTLRTFPQGQVYGGVLIYRGDVSAVTDAIIDFDEHNQDPKAAMIAAYTYIATIFMEVEVLLFYDGPSAPEGTFDRFLALPASRNTVKTQPYPQFIRSIPAVPHQARAAAHTVPIMQYTRPIVEEIINQTRILGRHRMMPGPAIVASLSLEPFMRTSLYHSSAGGAYPHSAAQPWTPFFLVATWLRPADDAAFRAAVRASADAIERVAIAAGQARADAVLYGNYAMREGTPLARVFGANLPRLQRLQARVDPHGLLGLTGGWALRGGHDGGGAVVATGTGTPPQEVIGAGHQQARRDL